MTIVEVSNLVKVHYTCFIAYTQQKKASILFNQQTICNWNCTE